MKITVCGSVKFAKNLVETCNQLKELGHEPIMHEEMYKIADGTAKEIIEDIGQDHGEAKRKYGFIKIWHGLIKSSDAVLACNFDKNGVANYVGANTLMEMAFGHVEDKKVFLLNKIPDPVDVSYVDEIKAVVDVALEGDLSKIE
jgi:hypothetical protein